MSDHAGQGKIQRASHDLRMELNRRLFNGELGPEILPWLNEQHEIMHICAEHFEGVSVSAKNLSDYRTGAYQKWLEGQQKVEHIKSLADYALTLAKASNRSLSDGAAQLIAGKYMEALSVDTAAPADGEEGAPAGIDHDMAFAIAELKKQDIAQEKLEQNARKMGQQDIALQQRDRQLALQEETAAWNVAKKILKALTERAAELEAVRVDTGDEEQKMKDIVRITFGDALLERMEQRRREALAE